MLSVCSGAFVLAAAGLLDRRRATTHWMYAEQLAARYPKIDVVADVLYVDQGQILTSAGTAAGIDLALHVVRSDHGWAVANAVARRMVVPPHRDGGQAQFVELPMPEHDRGLHDLLDWIETHLDEPLDTPTLARAAAMSPRTLLRRFQAVTGTTPHRWIQQRRVARAAHFLETTDLPVERIAALAGFGTATTLREAMRRHLHTTPTAHRTAFGVPSDNGSGEPGLAYRVPRQESPMLARLRRDRLQRERVTRSPRWLRRPLAQQAALPEYASVHAECGGPLTVVAALGPRQAATGILEQRRRDRAFDHQARQR